MRVAEVTAPTVRKTLLQLSATARKLRFRQHGVKTPDTTFSTAVPEERVAIRELCDPANDAPGDPGDSGGLW
ncbi:hypothetical protein SGLAU_25405 [Streptomyces glaucescens]|uniref:Uncharacterized protein n=1 Tax=Streptomyces glaucescens TaxID=1907 RepID=A0A089XCN9_STRGA|nr:hypothetical protein SGLAU_25405 [Streptomyces glaucescens]